MSKTIIPVTLILCLVLSAGLSACSPQEYTFPDPLPSPVSTTLPTPAETATSTGGETAYEGLGLTETQIRSLEETGSVSVDSVEVASKIAGFKVVVPSCVPEGYQAGKFTISISGAGLPKDMIKFNNTDVQIFYGVPGDKDAWIQFIQAPHKFGIGGGEPVELCGVTGERVLSEADPANSKQYGRVSYGWEKDGIWFALSGALKDNLNEEEMKKMACSVGGE